MSNALILCGALILDALLGEPRWLWSRIPHPVVLMGKVIAALDARLNAAPSQRVKGALTLIALIGAAWAIGAMLSMLGDLVALIIAAILLAQRSLVDHIRAVSTALGMSIGEARSAVAMIVSRNTNTMDDSAVARAAIESGAENFSDGVIAPAFWFLVGGLPGILIYKAVNTADSMIGYRNDQYEEFGKFAARTDDVLNWIPARLTGLLLAVTGGVWGLWADIAKDAHRHRSPNAGWPEAALSRALGIALAGPRDYDGVRHDLAWVNDGGRQPLTAQDIDAAIALLWKSWGLFLVLTLGLAVIF